MRRETGAGARSGARARVLSLVIGVLGAATGAGMVAGCSSFTADDAPSDVDAGGDAAVDDDATPPDASAPPLDASSDADAIAPCRVCTLATGQFGALELAASPTHAAWTITGGNGAIRAVPLTGGAVATLIPVAVQPRSLQLIGPRFTFVEGMQVKIGNVVASGATVAVQDVVGSAPLLGARYVGGALVVGHQTEIKYCFVKADLTCSTSVATSGAGGQLTGFTAPVDGDKVWYVVGANTIESRPTSSFVVAAKWTDATDARSLVADDTRVYWTSGTTGKVVSRDVTQSQSTALAAVANLLAPVGALAIDASYVYATLPSKGAVVRIAKTAGAAPQIVVAGLDQPKAIAIQGERAFVIANDAIVSFPKVP